jgi:hypothetical protein
MSTIPQERVDALLSNIQHRLDVHSSANNIGLEVVQDAYRQDDDWLVVVVAPTKEGIRAYDYVKVLGDVEKDLRQSGIANVLLVPAMAD